MLSVKNLVKIYQQKNAEPVRALDGVSIDFAENGLVFLLGKSGSGKSTLLNTIGGLDNFDEGEIIIKGKSSQDFTQSDFDSYRNTFIGFIFQEYNILENFTVAKNLALAIELQGKKPDEQEIHDLLEKVDMLQYAKRKPNQLSGGQKQRVAIARALIKKPEIIMADEPTGALDSTTGKQVMETLKKLSEDTLVIVVSHDREFAELYGDRIIELKDGKIISDVTKKEVVAEETSSGIKVIDNSIIHIKKGQKVNEAEISKIVSMINNNSENDTFISLDQTANKKFKESASINDEGNREKFEQTTKEDVVLEKYNPNDLSLIKSRLKFSDSFKMGASSLKNKVAKLVFTILLSFFAFTVFGVIDALACWNRGASVYQALTLTNQKAFLSQKRVADDMYFDDTSTDFSDLTKLKEKFPNHNFLGVVQNDNWKWNEIQLYDSTISLKSSQDSLKRLNVSGATTITAQDMQKFGFEMHDGELPDADNEIAISKKMFERMVEASNNQIDLTNYKTLNFSMYEFNPDGSSAEIKIVGIIDDKSDLSIYENMDEQERLNNYDLDEILSSHVSKLVYVNASQFDKMVSGGVNKYINFYYGDIDAGGISSAKAFNLLSTFKDNIRHNPAESLSYMKGGVEQYIANPDSLSLNKNEILLEEGMLSSIADYEQKIEEGLEIQLKDQQGNVVATLTVVGTTKNNGSVAGEDTINETLLPIFQGYSLVMSSLNGNESQDRELIEYLENGNGEGISFVVVNAATEMLDLLSEMLQILTTVFIWVAVAFAVFASLLLMNFIATSINYKKREIGVLRALGARGSDIFGIFFNESLIIACINFALAAVATILVCNIANTAIMNELNMELTLLNPSIRQILLLLAISIGTAFLSSFLPTFKISRKKPIDAINNR